MAYLPIHMVEFIGKGLKYLKARNGNHGARPSIYTLAKACQLSRGITLKVEGELLSLGRVVDPDEITAIESFLLVLVQKL